MKVRMDEQEEGELRELLGRPDLQDYCFCSHYAYMELLGGEVTCDADGNFTYCPSHEFFLIEFEKSLKKRDEDWRKL